MNKTFKMATWKLDNAVRFADGLEGEDEMDAADLLAAADDAQAAALLARDAAALLEAGAATLIEKARLLRQDGCGEGDDAA